MAEEGITLTKEKEGDRYGAWFFGYFLHWNKTLRKSVIILGRTKHKLDRLLEFLTWLIIFAGWLAFAFWIFTNRDLLLAEPIKLLFFWGDYDPLILFFLISLCFDLFLIYKRGEAKMGLKRMNYRLFSETKTKQRAKDKRPRKYEVSNAYSDKAIKVVENAFLLANRLRQTEVRVIHLFRALLRDKEIQNLFIRLNVDAKKLVEMIDNHLVEEDNSKYKYRSKLSSATKEVLISAFVDAFKQKQDSVTVLNIIGFCYEKDEMLSEILYELEIDQDKIINTVEWFRVNKRLLENYKAHRQLALFKPGSGMNRAYTAIATPTLDRISHDLTLKAKFGQLDICVGRKKEINSIFEAFIGGHNGVLLVGQPGVGKSTIIGGLAQLMVREEVPKFLKDKRLVELDVSRLVSGATPAQAEERLLICLNELGRSGNIILYLDNVENLIGISAGTQESLDLSEVLAEAIGRHNLFCLASATTENYSRYIENKALGSVMTTVLVKEPDTNESIQILESKVSFVESKYDIYVVYGALEQAVKMSSRYLHDKFLPLKAINLLESAAIISAKSAKHDPGKSICSKEEVARAISESTGIPVNKVSSSEREKLLNLEKEIHQRMINQEEAVKAVSASLRRARAQMKEGKRPIASFLFMGPTGVGKTELAKSVAQIYFGDEKYLIRLDMSEYQHPDSVRKMIGDVDGALGYLTEAVRKQPFALILLDEIEKAHPDILNLFLQLLDDGRLTDGQGRTISFTESIIIATSNIGAVYIQEQIKAKTELAIIKQELIDNQMNKYMRPELINRFDGIIVFKPLSEENIVDITGLMLKKINKNLTKKGISLKAEKEGVRILAKQGYDPKFGARPLRRLLQDKIENIIANKILSGELKRRDTVMINKKAEVTVIKAAKL